MAESRSPMQIRLTVALLAAAVVAAVASPHALGGASPSTGALQIALRAQGLYAGPLDGIAGPGTVRALRSFQQRAGLPPSGRLDRRTRLAMPRLGRPLAGKRVVGMRSTAGWDVSVLEFGLARLGFDPGRIDGRFTTDTRGAVQRFQRYARLPADGMVGKATFRALRRIGAPSTRQPLAWPLHRPVVRKFGLAGMHLFPGIYMSAPYGTPLAAAGDGVITWAGWKPGGLGLLVAIRHAGGVESLYGHLSRVDVRVGQRVVRGALVGLVGWTGKASRPHLYLEVRVRGAAVDPLTVLR